MSLVYWFLLAGRYTLTICAVVPVTGTCCVQPRTIFLHYHRRHWCMNEKEASSGREGGRENASKVEGEGRKVGTRRWSKNVREG